MTTTVDNVRPSNISADFPFKSHHIAVQESRIHYIEQGSGDPIVFVHGIPTWSYTWRNVLPLVAQMGRCIAPDLIGMGKSGKPDIAYHLTDHINYFTGFVEALGLKNITLVMHGWGSVVGLGAAVQHKELFKGLVFMESYLRPNADPKMTSIAAQELAQLATMPDKAYQLIIHDNIFINKILPGITLRKLSEQEMAHYREPFRQQGSRKLLWQYVLEQPLVNRSSGTLPLIARYSEWLQTTAIPKLLLYVLPGLLTTMSDVQWARDHLANLTTVDLGTELHNFQEGCPEEIAIAINDWYESSFSHKMINEK